MCERYINVDKSDNMAHHGTVEADTEKGKDTDRSNLSSSSTSSSTQVGERAAVQRNQPETS